MLLCYPELIAWRRGRDGQVGRSDADTTVCLSKSVWDSCVAPGITHILEAIQGFLCVNYEFHMDEAHAFY